MALMKPRIAIAASTGLLLIAGRIADLATTFHFTPNLRREANPLVHNLGMGWNGLLATNLCLTLLVLAGLYYYGTRSSREVEWSPSEGAWGFAGRALYGQALSPGRLILRLLTCWPLPRNWKQTLRLLGLSCGWMVVFSSFTAAFGWWANHAWKLAWWMRLNRSLHIGVYPLMGILIGLLGGALAVVVFFVTEYREATARPGEKTGAPAGE